MRHIGGQQLGELCRHLSVVSALWGLPWLEKAASSPQPTPFHGDLIQWLVDMGVWSPHPWLQLRWLWRLLLADSLRADWGLPWHCITALPNPRPSLSAPDANPMRTSAHQCASQSLLLREPNMQKKTENWSCSTFINSELRFGIMGSGILTVWMSIPGQLVLTPGLHVGVGMPHSVPKLLPVGN